MEQIISQLELLEFDNNNKRLNPKELHHRSLKEVIREIRPLTMIFSCLTKGLATLGELNSDE